MIAAAGFDLDVAGERGTFHAGAAPVGEEACIERFTFDTALLFRVGTEAEEAAQRGGGIIGAVDLLECFPYRDAEQFKRDQTEHLNDPDWFIPPCMFGFRLERPETLPFRRCPGNVRFFTVPTLDG